MLATRVSTSWTMFVIALAQAATGVTKTDPTSAVNHAQRVACLAQEIPRHLAVAAQSGGSYRMVFV